jgi:acyl dehydratase/NAD(P)-dependent dehydrogenase (short-subunit alcohol dehydrogenase family)
MELDTKIFDCAEQARFAYLSGDGNPIHVDAVAARRTQMGARVVHGINAVLWALEALFRREELSPSSLQVNFLAPIYVGETAVAALERRSDSQLRINISVGTALATTLTVGLGVTRKSASSVNARGVHAADWPSKPLELDWRDMERQVGVIGFAHPPESVTGAFPALCRAMSSPRVATMVTLSRLVGMICPGLHSLLKSYSLDLVEIDRDDVLRYAAFDVCERMNLVRMRVSGPGIRGEVAAFRRIPPIVQPTIEEVAALVPKGVYAGATVLVVGGSRGLGEVTAKACAAGGADVHVTYATGRADAERVAGEIARHGATCAVHWLDVREDVRAQLANIPVAPTHVYYFASGPMKVRRTGFLESDVLAGFLCFYTTGFIETSDALLAKAPGHQLRMFYPSSTAVSDATRGLAEYAMAKAAGEALCQSMNRYVSGAHVLCRRLPRMLTDQTATVLRAKSSPVLDVMLPIVNEMQTGTGEKRPLEQQEATAP